MPSGTGYVLDSVTLELKIGPGLGGLSLTLYGGTSSAPSGAPLLSFTTPTLVADSNHHPAVFTPANSFTLQPLSNYWLVLDGNGAFSDSVAWATLPSIAPTGIATFLGQTRDASLPPITPIPDGTPFLAFQVDATPLDAETPEPGTITLLGAGIAALAFLRRR